MADGEKGEAAEGGPGAADEGGLEFVDGDYRLFSLERVQADVPEEGEDHFAAKFQIDGPNANAEVEITVSDFTDEVNVVSIAQHTLHVAMTMWGWVTSNRFIRVRAADLLKRGTSRRR